MAKSRSLIARYTTYALFRMEQRDIAQSAVEAVLAMPEVMLPAREGRHKAWGRVDGRSIMVVYEPSDGGGNTVVTVYPQRRRPR